jgi:hypothetical protein
MQPCFAPLVFSPLNSRLVLSFFLSSRPQVAEKTPALSVLVQALKETNLTRGSLSDPQAVQTVFAPTNAAFTKLASALGLSLEQLLSRTDAVRGRAREHARASKHVPYACRSCACACVVFPFLTCAALCRRCS